jgi:glutathione synthase/RimK-type ligase-like ATP-grasp enzyme
MTSSHRPIAIVTAQVARDLDEDLAPLLGALAARRLPAEAVAWDDPGVDWSRYRVALLRSTWDYTSRLREFLAWCARVARLACLHNPLEVVRWNVDKHYLGELARAGVPVVPSHFVEPGESAEAAWRAWLQRHPHAELVVKPCVGAGSRDAQRHGREEGEAIVAHIGRLLAAGRSVLLQPYLPSVDAQGETALIHFDGVYSHAIRKAALLQRGSAPTRALFAAERIEAREPQADERALAQQALAALPFATPLYARVDIIRDAEGAPRVLELELTEPSLFFEHAPLAAARCVDALVARL